MTVAEIINVLEDLADTSLQEEYDNAGLITGYPAQDCSGVLVALDCIEATIEEAVERGCNMIVCHHPIIFRGLKKLNGKNYVERTVIEAIKHGIAIYAIHTNLDNVVEGVNKTMADKLGLIKTQTLIPKEGVFRKLAVFVPKTHHDEVMTALFKAGAGKIGNYSECSFSYKGSGTFKPEPGADPQVGEIGKRYDGKEIRIEVLFPARLQRELVQALLTAHPYEEVAYDVFRLENQFNKFGAGLIGELTEPREELELLLTIQQAFQAQGIRYTKLLGRPVKKVALCGGAGSFALSAAIAAGADIFISADFKYHDFFDADGRILIADIGHYETEQFSVDLLQDVLLQNFPNFAVLKTSLNSNPINYL